ncbi:hypothetical protein [Actinomyces sp. ZJ308]|uniref:hypothetical protein n=1 Tax=Actinomyces sp. ZJ308 TaxID=2708342 RepID=UPI0014235111|nr:hypothetical protein [Actinomyces sp. ZJ308]
MATTVAYALLEQADELKKTALLVNLSDDAKSACLRASYLFCVASVDSYFGELAYDASTRVVNYGEIGDLRRLADFLGVKFDVLQDERGSERIDLKIRQEVDKMTLLKPDKIDRMILNIFGFDGSRQGDTVWHDIALLARSKYNSVRMQLDLIYERRNKIAHAGDWDMREFSFRPISEERVDESRRFVGDVIRGTQVWIERNSQSFNGGRLFSAEVK